MSNDEVVDGNLTWDVVHAQLTQIAKRRATLDAEEARWLRRAEALQIWKPLGMVNALDYMEHARLRAARRARAPARLRAVIKLDPTSASHVGPTSLTDAVAQARSALVKMGWNASTARAAIDRAAAELPAEATVEAIVRAALRHCPAPLHTQVRARDARGPTWNVRLLRSRARLAS